MGPLLVMPCVIRDPANAWMPKREPLCRGCDARIVPVFWIEPLSVLMTMIEWLVKAPVSGGLGGSVFVIVPGGVLTMLPVTGTPPWMQSIVELLVRPPAPTTVHCA